MKRSKEINLEKMRKSTFLNYPLLKPLALAITSITLVACSDPEQEVQIVYSVDDCTANTNFTLEQCNVAYKNALEEAQKTAPRYNSQTQCEAEFGYNQCNRSGDFFMPFMAGYMVSNLLNNTSQSYNPVYHYRSGNPSFRNRIMMADGTILGSAGQQSYKIHPNNLRLYSNSVRTNSTSIRTYSSNVITKPKPNNLKTKPKTTRTVSRGGFGSVASAKSNWGGGKKSSWGG